MDLNTYLKTETQADFAKKVGVTQGAVSHWINGRARVPAERLADIERATGGKVSRHDLRPDLYPAEEAA